MLSIGIIAEDGREYYAQASWCLLHRANEWVQNCVLPHLKTCYGNHHLGPARTITESHAVHDTGKCDLYTIHDYPDECPWRNHSEMILDILVFMDIEKYGKPELWGYYSAYDHVVFCQLFGTMMNLPNEYPMLTYDLRQWLDMNELESIRQDDSTHNALDDAKWIAEAYKHFVSNHR